MTNDETLKITQREFEKIERTFEKVRIFDSFVFF